jgi:hypothetical protein
MRQIPIFLFFLQIDCHEAVMCHNRRHACVVYNREVRAVSRNGGFVRQKQGKRSREYHGGTHLATVRRKADHAHIAAQRITSSAWNSSVGGIVSPSALAVLRLMTSSKRVGCSTGKSAGLAPFRILSTCVAPCRHRSGGLAA